MKKILIVLSSTIVVMGLGGCIIEGYSTTDYTDQTYGPSSSMAPSVTPSEAAARAALKNRPSAEPSRASSYHIPSAGPSIANTTYEQSELTIEQENSTWGDIDEEDSLESSKNASSTSTNTGISMDDIFLMAEEIRADNPEKSNEEISTLIAQKIKKARK